MRHFRVKIWLLTKTLFPRNGQHLSLDKCLLSRSLLFFPRFLGTQTSQRQADFSLRPGLGQGSWEFLNFFKIQISRMRKSRNKSEKFPIGLTWAKFKSLISQSSRQLKTSYWCHVVQNLTDLSNDDVSRKYWQIAKKHSQIQPFTFWALTHLLLSIGRALKFYMLTLHEIPFLGRVNRIALSQIVSPLGGVEYQNLNRRLLGTLSSQKLV